MEAIKIWLGKAAAHSIRIAACIHVWNCESPHKSPVSSSEMELAIDITYNIIEQLKFIYDPYRYKSYINADKIIKSLLKISPECDDKLLKYGITSRDIQQRTGLNKEETNNALYVLEDYRYLAIFDNGSPNISVILHPDFFTWRNPMLK